MKTHTDNAEESRLRTFAERSPPTLWPTELNDATQIKRVLESCQRENQSLKALVVHLSEMIIRHIVKTS
jgi:hypothetical protein